MKKDNTSAERQRAYRQRMEAEGLRFVHVWIPKEMESRIKEIAEALREGKKVIIEESPHNSAVTPEQG